MARANKVSPRCGKSPKTQPSIQSPRGPSHTGVPAPPGLAFTTQAATTFTHWVMAVRDPREPAKAQLTAWTFQAAALGRETPESERVWGLQGPQAAGLCRMEGLGEPRLLRALLSTDQGGTVPTSSSRPGTALLPAATVRKPHRDGTSGRKPNRRCLGCGDNWTPRLQQNTTLNQASKASTISIQLKCAPEQRWRTANTWQNKNHDSWHLMKDDWTGNGAGTHSPWWKTSWRRQIQKSQD